MFVQSLKLHNFRNLSGEINLGRRINVFIAPNGYGKTNFLEALYFLAGGRSFRTNCEIYIIRNDLLTSHKMAYARIDSQLVDPLGNETHLEIFLEPIQNQKGLRTSKQLKVNGRKVRRSQFIRNAYAVIFSPKTVDFISASPSIRRRDMDEFLCIYDPDYLRLLTEYLTVIRQRNKLLQMIGRYEAQREELPFWNMRFIDLAAPLIYKRLQFFAQIEDMIAKCAQEIFHGEESKLSFQYQSKFVAGKTLKSIRTRLDEKVAANINREIIVGSTLYGPHREDVQLFQSGKVLQELGSRGQQRLAVFLYKIAQWYILREKIHDTPILLLDDLLSELDHTVKQHVLRFLRGIDGQVILSALDARELNKKFIAEAYQITL